MRKWLPGLLVVLVFAASCSSSRQAFDPQRKYAPRQLQQDFTCFRSVLEESHPSLYWFTPKDSIDYYFDAGYRSLTDSMTEVQFRNVLSNIISKIRCGHTSVRFSNAYNDYLDTVKIPIFPLYMKILPGSATLITNLNRRDSILRRGVVITGINGRSMTQLVDTFFNFISGDGNAINGKYQALSNPGTFGSIYRNVLGLTPTFNITYLDSTGQERETVIPVFDPKTLAANRPRTPGTTPNAPRPPRREREPRQPSINGIRSVQIDTSLSSAYMTINTFGRGNRLRSFYRRSFRELKKQHIQHLVVDVRSNGGGDAGLSTKLTRYLTNHPFKLADSLYAVRRSSRYRKHIQWQSAYWAMMKVVTHKADDGKYHFGYFERHYFKPKKKDHFDGDIYIITGGNSFSATTLFAGMLKGQSNVKIIGEETGGGSYGNSAWMMPDVVLPNSKVRFRLPKFRLVMNQSMVKDGRGLMPDIEAATTIETIRMGIDPKVETVRKMIIQKNALAHH